MIRAFSILLVLAALAVSAAPAQAGGKKYKTFQGEPTTTYLHYQLENTTISGYSLSSGERD